jgi:hypothetical protein
MHHMMVNSHIIYSCLCTSKEWDGISQKNISRSCLMSSSGNTIMNGKATLTESTALLKFQFLSRS